MSYGFTTIVVQKNYNVLQRSYTTLRYLFLTPTVCIYCNCLQNNDKVTYIHTLLVAIEGQNNLCNIMHALMYAHKTYFDSIPAIKIKMINFIQTHTYVFL